MASGARANICVLLMATLFMGTAAAERGGKDGSCIQRVDEVPMPGSCRCYHRCSDGSGLTNAASQICFVNCVLGWGCVCPGAPSSKPPEAPSTVLPALLDGTIRVPVTRPMVSRSRDEKDEAEEVLVVEVTFEDDDPPKFSIHVNAPVGAERQLFDAGDSVRPDLKFATEEIRTGKAVLRNPIGHKLEDIGADGDETIIVTFWPLSDLWCREHRLTINAVRIEYEPKNK